MPSYLPPRALQLLPFNLLRSQNYPRDPAQVGQAIETYGGALPTYMPQRMMFTRWKTPPYNVAWAQNAASVMTALEQQHFKVALLRRAAAAPQAASPREMADALGAERLPQPSDNIDPAVVDYEEPIGRNALPMRRLSMTARELNAFAEEQDAELARLEDKVHERKHRAMAQVAQRIEDTESRLMAASPPNDPWFMR
jgi:hypothetical protein